MHPNFLSEYQLQLLQRDMKHLETDGKFVVNGLSDVRKGLKGEPTESAAAVDASNQGFDNKYDRSVCPIPWWKDSLLLSTVDESENDAGTAGTEDDSVLLHSIQIKLQRLRRELSQLLERPTMMNNDLDHECYYSQSRPASSLARHMDERHEETKGPRGWLLPSRRSLSWLIYLSETDNEESWDGQINGGLLRTFPQKYYRNDHVPNNDNAGNYWEGTVDCGSHNGNLQVAWLLAQDGKEGGIDKEGMHATTTHPVFLDSWFDHMNPYTGEMEPHCILYIVRKPTHSKDEGSMRIEYITVPWSIDAVQGNVADFVSHRATLESIPNGDGSPLPPGLFVRASHAQQFALLEDRDGW